ncbi:brahma-associated protein of 60 kDa-like [Panonychus citri]|uniref:brahma-associated protein of 60 kDa-like n=1 Tax=Panonychus citri TaxID=50023 RepID=UPI002307651D|nr:brahma-associated protein of 60 kDa-like [Panonychus citri]
MHRPDNMRMPPPHGPPFPPPVSPQRQPVTSFRQGLPPSQPPPDHVMMPPPPHGGPPHPPPGHPRMAPPQQQQQQQPLPHGSQQRPMMPPGNHQSGGIMSLGGPPQGVNVGPGVGIGVGNIPNNVGGLVNVSSNIGMSSVASGGIVSVSNTGGNVGIVGVGGMPQGGPIGVGGVGGVGGMKRPLISTMMTSSPVPSATISSSISTSSSSPSPSLVGGGVVGVPPGIVSSGIVGGVGVGGGGGGIVGVMGPGPGPGPGLGPGQIAGQLTTTSASTSTTTPSMKKKKKLGDVNLQSKVRDLVPESQAYMDLICFEKKLDFHLKRKRLEIIESSKKPMKLKRKLRIFISNTFFPGKHEVDGNGEELHVPSWELRVEGRLLDDQNTPKIDQSKIKRKFSSFFKSLVIELDKDLYGPDNHLVEWHRTPNTTETDGFQVKRPGNKNVRCTILLLLDYQPLQFRLDPRLARLLGIHTQTRPVIINALWQYIKTHKLQDAHEREFINCDKYLEQIFQCARMKFAEIPSRLHTLLHPPDPIVINHLISVEGPETKKTSCYDIDVEVDDPLKVQMNNFIVSTHNQQDIQNLDNKIHETVETINQLKTNREFFLSFAKDPQQFIHKWLLSQMRDLKTMTDQAGNPEEERRSDFFFQPWTQEAVCRYFYGKVQLRRAELEQALGIRNA